MDKQATQHRCHPPTDTLKDSTTTTSPPMTGEFGWQGGVTAQTPHGYWIMAFSGGKSKDDVTISRVGLATTGAAASHSAN